MSISVWDSVLHYNDWNSFGYAPVSISRLCTDAISSILAMGNNTCHPQDEAKNRDNFYRDGAIIPLGDESIRLCRVKTRDNKGIRVYKKTEAGGKHCLCLSTGVENQPELYRRAVTKWLREYARVKLTKMVELHATIMQVTVERISIKEQKTRWGSCSSKGNVNFNWKLILMPERIQEYIVVHELAHRKQMNHSKDFWLEVEKVLPDYIQRKNELREIEYQYIKY